MGHEVIDLDFSVKPKEGIRTHSHTRMDYPSGGLWTGNAAAASSYVQIQYLTVISSKSAYGVKCIYYRTLIAASYLHL